VTGRLTIVGTPIGNLADVTDRIRRTLATADVICAEDTRRTRRLLTAYDVHPPMLVSIREHNEQRQAAQVVRWLADGRSVAYVTDAGMPVLSDPGERLVRAVIAADGVVAVAPGPDAASSALLVSGLPAARWCFEGFLPVKGRARRERLAAVAAEPRTVVLFEAPHRLLRTLGDLAASAGARRQVAVANDLSKRYESVWRGPIGEVLAELDRIEPRGEFALVLAGATAPARSAALNPR
jgi:16S rRNA (cytidine1402-2'-O)-methyltransferase